MYKTSSQNANILKLLKTLQEINSIAHKTTWKHCRAIYKPTKLIKIYLVAVFCIQCASKGIMLIHHRQTAIS